MTLPLQLEILEKENGMLLNMDFHLPINVNKNRYESIGVHRCSSVVIFKCLHLSIPALKRSGVSPNPKPRHFFILNIIYEYLDSIKNKLRVNEYSNKKEHRLTNTI